MKSDLQVQHEGEVRHDRFAAVGAGCVGALAVSVVVCLAALVVLALVNDGLPEQTSVGAAFAGLYSLPIAFAAVVTIVWRRRRASRSGRPSQ